MADVNVARDEAVSVLASVVIVPLDVLRLRLALPPDAKLNAPVEVTSLVWKVSPSGIITVDVASRVRVPVDVIVPPLTAKLLAVVISPVLVILQLASVKLISSSAEPIAIVSEVVLSVAILMVLPAVPVPIFIVLALLPVPRLTAPVVPESSVRALVVSDVIVPVPAKPILVASTEIVSILATPVNAPPVVTLSP